MNLTFNEIRLELKRLSQKKNQKKRFSKTDRKFILECKKSKLNQISSWATELMPNKQPQRKRKNSISGFFQGLTQGKPSIQYAIKNV